MTFFCNAPKIHWFSLQIIRIFLKHTIFGYMFKTACNSGVITLWGWPEFLLTGNGSRFASYLVYCCCNCCAAQQEGSRAMLCTYVLTLLLTVWRAALNFWLATLSVQLYFPCTPSSQGVGVSTAATNSLGLSQSPFPLFPLRSSSVFSLSLDCLGSKAVSETLNR